MTSAATLKDRAPRVVLDLANSTTRSYGIATARWRVLPDFLIVGTKRGGTTSLWNWLDAHPQVLSMFPRARGLKSTEYFFNRRPASESWYRSHFHTRTYRAMVSRKRGPVVNGEASPYYMYGPHVPRQMAAEVPDAKLVVLLRDPVDRAFSHYQERFQQGVETLDFAEALAREEERIADDRQRALADPGHYAEAMDFCGYRDRGVYLPQLQRLHAAYPAEQVLVLRSEDLYAAPQDAFDQTCDFLGIERHQMDHPRRHNEIKRLPMDESVRSGLEEFYRPHNEALEAYLDRSFGWDR